MFIEEIPIHVLLHRDVKEVDKHELAVQSGICLRLLVDLAHLDHQVFGHPVLQVRSKLLTLFVGGRNLQRVNRAVLRFGDVDCLQVGCLLVDDFEQCLQTRGVDVGVGPLWIAREVLRLVRFIFCH